MGRFDYRIVCKDEDGITNSFNVVELVDSNFTHMPDKYGNNLRMKKEVAEAFHWHIYNYVGYKQHTYTLSNGSYVKERAGENMVGWFLKDGTRMITWGDDTYYSPEDHPEAPLYSMKTIVRYKGAYYYLNCQRLYTGGPAKGEYEFKINFEPDYQWEAKWLKGSDVRPPEPFGPGSDTGGGEGDFNNETDTITPPALPGGNQDKLFFSYVYNPTYQQVIALQHFLWSSTFDITSFKKIFTDPIECITGLLQVPCKPKLYPDSQNIILGNIDTKIPSAYVSSRFAEVNCGEITINEYWGNALDYSPYTNITLYLPYIGYKQIDSNDVMNKKLGVKYTIDVCTGACVAIVTVDGSVRYQYSGECGLMYPITNKDNAPIYSSIMQTVAAGAVMMSTGGAGSVAAGAAKTIGSTLATDGVALLGAGLTAANAASNIKPSIQRSGVISGACGFLGVQTPYALIERPEQSLASGYNSYIGYPSNITMNLGSCTGFTQIESIKLDNIPGAKAAEISEIDQLLKGGVIF